MEWDWQKFYDKVYSWLASTGPKILLAVLVLIVGMWILRRFNKWVAKIMAGKNFNASLRYFLQNLISISLQFVLIFFVLQVAGIQLTFFAAILAGLSVATGLALSGTLQNFVSGILILILKPYKVGDIINIQSQEGTVTAIQLFYTTVLTYDNKTITVPNGQLSNNIVVNLSKEGKRRVDIDLKLSYAIDFEQAKKAIQSALAGEKDMLTDPEPRIGISSFESDKYVVIVNVWIPAHGFIDNRLHLHEVILRELKNNDIKLPGM